MNFYYFTKYTEKGASSRYRSYQYLSLFKEYDIDVLPFFDDKYVVNGKLNIFYVIKRYLNRLFSVLNISKNDIVFLEYEFMPYMLFNVLYFNLFKIKYIVDYDDAIFHNYDQHPNGVIRFLLKNKIKKVIKYARYVVTGSPYLTEYASKYNKNVIEIPTSIDFSIYQKEENRIKENIFVIGWIGSKTTSRHLVPLLPVFESLQVQGIKFQLHFIGFDSALENKFSHLPVKFIQWNSETEIAEIKQFSVGIMPLVDYPFARGKCAFKLIQYMGCGKPTISSPFQANLKVDRNNENLFAESPKEWELRIKEVIKNAGKYQDIGERNAKVIENHYSIQANYNKYLKLFKLLH